LFFFWLLFLVPLSTPTNQQSSFTKAVVFFCPLCFLSLSLCFSLLLFFPLFVIVVVAGYFLHAMFADMSTVLFCLLFLLFSEWVVIC